MFCGTLMSSNCVMLSISSSKSPSTSTSPSIISPLSTAFVMSWRFSFSGSLSICFIRDFTSLSSSITNSLAILTRPFDFSASLLNSSGEQLVFPIATFQLKPVRSLNVMYDCSFCEVMSSLSFGLKIFCRLFGRIILSPITSNNGKVFKKKFVKSSKFSLRFSFKLRVSLNFG